MTKGTRVTTPLGSGGVAYVRMAPPLYNTVEAVSVVLDSRRLRSGYVGTMFAAVDVKPDDAPLLDLLDSSGRIVASAAGNEPTRAVPPRWPLLIS